MGHWLRNSDISHYWIERMLMIQVGRQANEKEFGFLNNPLDCDENNLHHSSKLSYEGDPNFFATIATITLIYDV